MTTFREMASAGKAIVTDALNRLRNGTDTKEAASSTRYAPHERNPRAGDRAVYWSALVEDVPLSDTPFAQSSPSCANSTR